ncbi:XFP-like protein [Pedobacter psychrotolerans]|uniref:XFP-like protein n=1 Tax=Pedobacter psychrotolerans TaxID=1843235 RepID=A0A4R2H0F8_9SPHI|nr:hypothetical protein [Pedobacter psychrotolerans]TCO17753.1 XFP-like protein [Pedobacter psychrotolerans]GGE71106.1 hypothetical protein GCM10011413_42340 [Pedobacter psychrotolerans]
MQEISEAVTEKIRQYWQAVNYLSAGQVYLQANPLLLNPEIKKWKFKGAR